MQPIGDPKGYLQTAGNGTVLPLVAILAYGNMNVMVTTVSAHGLSTGDQVSIQGISNKDAAGSYSVTISTPTQFFYQTFVNIPAGTLLLPHTRVTTMNIGIPRTMTTLPQTGT